MQKIKAKEGRRKHSWRSNFLCSSMVFQASPMVKTLGFSLLSFKSPFSALFLAAQPLPPSFSLNLFIDLGLKGVFLGWNDEILDLGSRLSPPVSWISLWRYFSWKINWMLCFSPLARFSVFLAGFCMWMNLAGGEIPKGRISRQCLHESCNSIS